MLLVATDLEPGVIITEVRLSDLAHQKREHLGGIFILVIEVAVHKDVLATGVTMQISVQGKRSFLGQAIDQLLREEHSRVQCFRGEFPTAI